MPELPEVETMVRGIRPAAIGREIAGFRRSRCLRKPILISPEPRTVTRAVRGQVVTDVRRFAKRVVIELSGGGCFAIEPRMTGLMLVANPPSTEHLRATWRFVDSDGLERDTLWFWDRRGLGTIRYFQPGTFETELAGRLGPDALAMTNASWRAAFSRTKRPVKVALLDQKLVAGIGNLYASEILFLARIDPATPAHELTTAAISRLERASRQILEDAIRHEGSTLSDGTYRNVLAQSGQYQNAHQVYARENQPCTRCAEPITRLVQAQRSTFYCGSCQSRK